MRRYFALMTLVVWSIMGTAAAGQEGTTSLREQATAALRKAVDFYRTRVASHGGYVYHYSEDLQQRWGEGPATRERPPSGWPT
jgi:hypothetical protein